MKTELTKREKTLVFFTSIVVLVFVAFQFGITPLYNTYTEKVTEYDELTFKITMLNLKLQNEDVMRKAYENAKVNYEEITKRYPPVKSNEEIDQILTGLCRINNINTVTLGISNTKEKPKATEEENAAPEAFTETTANMKLSGDYNSLKKLIATVEDIDYIRIGKISFSHREDTSISIMDNISIFFRLTMLNDSM